MKENPARSDKQDVEFRTKLFLRLLMNNQGNIHAFILSLVPNWHDSADLMQETTSTMWVKFNEFKLGTNFLSWAMSVAHFEVLKFRKKRRKDHLHLADEIVESIAQEAISYSDETEDILEILRTCLSRLKQPDQKIIQLRYHKSKTIKEVARYIGKSVESLYKAMARIHHNLLECVQRNLAREVQYE